MNGPRAFHLTNGHVGPQQGEQTDEFPTREGEKDQKKKKHIHIGQSSSSSSSVVRPRKPF